MACAQKSGPDSYPAGSWGPESANTMLARTGRTGGSALPLCHAAGRRLRDSVIVSAMTRKTFHRGRVTAWPSPLSRDAVDSTVRVPESLTERCCSFGGRSTFRTTLSRGVAAPRQITKTSSETACPTPRPSAGSHNGRSNPPSVVARAQSESKEEPISGSARRSVYADSSGWRPSRRRPLTHGSEAL